jgi:C_GCAxxG_C_C family probable redox protein
MGLEEDVRRNFDLGFNCAESVLLTVSRYSELAKEGAESFIPRIATGFGGGIARNGDTCGALTGGVIAIGLAIGRSRPEESREPCYSVVDRFYNEFVRTFGTCRCRELTGVDLRMPEGSDAHRPRIHHERCTPLVEWAARRAHQLIKENQKSQS